MTVKHLDAFIRKFRLSGRSMDEEVFLNGGYMLLDLKYDDHETDDHRCGFVLKSQKQEHKETQTQPDTD